jgi:hypothetical protein
VSCSRFCPSPLALRYDSIAQRRPTRPNPEEQSSLDRNPNTNNTCISIDIINYCYYLLLLILLLVIREKWNKKQEDQVKKKANIICMNAHESTTSIYKYYI